MVFDSVPMSMQEKLSLYFLFFSLFFLGVKVTWYIAFITSFLELKWFKLNDRNTLKS